MSQITHIVEPTLADEAGHCFSFISNLCKSSEKTHFLVWADHLSKLTFLGENVELKKHFFRKIRKLQCFFLYKKLLGTPDKILISTASRLDLAIFSWIARDAIPKNKVYFYFHWINSSPKKLVQLKKFAKMQPNLVILGPTSTVISVFQEAGFKQATLIPYPSSANISKKSEQALPFKRVWYAGAARQDKGFGKVVDLIKYVNHLGLNIPFTLQTSPDHYGKYDDATRSDITRLHRIPYKYIEICGDTLSNDQYKSYFLGAICIQPYLASDFADRISGVTLDALLTGSPIVCSEGTWTARQVERFKAGIVFKSTSPADMLDSIEKVITDYEHYSKNARLASQTLQKEHSATHLAKTLAESID